VAAYADHVSSEQCLQVAAHVGQVGNKGDDPVERLEAVLQTFALMQHKHHGTELAALVHGGDHVVRAQQHLLGFIEGLVTEGAKKGSLRKDVAPDELARFCLHALTAAGSLPSQAAVRRLVVVNVAGLRRPR
jgi:hypothetical protein